LPANDTVRKLGGIVTDGMGLRNRVLPYGFIKQWNLMCKIPLWRPVSEVR
jgi:hypothetical protein